MIEKLINGEGDEFEQGISHSPGQVCKCNLCNRLNCLNVCLFFLKNVFVHLHRNLCNASYLPCIITNAN